MPDLLTACVIDPQAHVDWAERVGDGIARHYGFRRRSPGWEDIRAEAVVVVFEKAPEFDPARVPPDGDFDGAFRGWAHPTVRGRCQREAIRQRNGGTYRTRREEDHDGPVAVGGMDDEAAASIPDHRPAADLDDDPPHPAPPEPRRVTPPPPAPMPALEAERTVLAARLSALDELKRHLTGLVSLVSADPGLAALAAAELKAVLGPKGKREGGA